MQGRKKSGPSTGRSPSPSSASPSSSSSAHAAFDSVQQQQQQIFRQIQSLQQQQFRKSEGDQGHLPYQSPSIHGGVVPGRNFQPSSNFLMKNSCNSSQQHGSPQAHEGNQNEGHGSEQNTRNPLNQTYFQYAYHAAQQKPFTNNQAQNQPGKMTMVNCPSGREKESRTSGIKMPELMSLQSASQAQASLGKKSAENFSNAPDKQIGHMVGVEQRGELKPQQIGVGQFVQTNLRPPIHTIQSQTSPANISNKQFSISQLQAVHNWALERGIDMSLPGNANLVAQLIPSCQSRQSEIQKSDENNMPAHQLKQQVNFSLAGNENSEHGCIVGSSSGQAGILKSRQIHQTGLISTPGQNTTPIADKTQMQQQYSVQSKRENQNDRVSNRHPMSDGNAVPVVHPSPVPSGMYNTIDRANLKTPVTGSEIHQMQNFRDLRQLDRSFPQSGTTSSTEDARNHSSTRVEHSQLPQQRVGFTKQQLHVLKAQILAFRRLKNTPQSGQGIMPEELLRSIIPPPLDLQPHQQFPLPRMVRQDSSTAGNPDENAGPSITNDKAPQVAMIKSQNMPKEELPIGPAHNEKTPVVPGFTRKPVEHAKIGASEKLDHSSLIKSEMEDKHGNEKNSSKCDQDKMAGRIQSIQITATEPGHAKKSLVTSNAPVKEDASKHFLGQVKSESSSCTAQFLEAVKYGKIQEAYRLLVTSDVNPNLTCDDIYPDDICHLNQNEKKHCDPAICPKIKETGDSVNCLQGCSTLHLACHTGGLALVELLLQYGGDINLQDFHGRTPLHHCVVLRNNQLAKYLIKRGAKPSFKDGGGQTALERAMEYGPITDDELLLLLVE